ncbi:M20 family metallopeptidase [Azospirillum sp. TSO35-2]|uniref:M20 family metallopeptidase n=1 Tax=Azospirillum sp. TSO35-2 TaxID=716796 RepID=UPI000D612658|nr:M20 family metallopeptidase [Azospirillum sp. TSO35-2]PWC31366.1 peptidase M20 [Azospirillum sp. TSO35-2]
MTPLAQRASDWLASRRDEMEDTLRRIVDIDSGSRDAAGIDAVGEAMAALLEADGIAVTRIPNDVYGGVLKAEIPGRTGGAPVLVMGHRDTVYPKGTVAARPFSRDGDTAFGPGVADMKGGLVVDVFVLRALKAAGGTGFPLIGLFTADEEIGSPSGRAVIEQVARGARAAFNAEPGRASGNVVTARKGGLTLDITVTGRAAHSGVNHADGASAIGALAAKITALHALTDYPSGITTNVGVIRGGRTHNTVADHAEAALDIRFRSVDQLDGILARIEAILAAEDVPGTSASYQRGHLFMPLEERHSAELFARYQTAATEIGFAVDGEFTGGCADSGFTGALGVPSLCGLGPVGGAAHTEREWCRLDTLVPRAQALAVTIADLDA